VKLAIEVSARRRLIPAAQAAAAVVLSTPVRDNGPQPQPLAPESATPDLPHACGQDRGASGVSVYARGPADACVASAGRVANRRYCSRRAGDDDGFAKQRAGAGPRGDPGRTTSSDDTDVREDGPPMLQGHCHRDVNGTFM